MTDSDVETAADHERAEDGRSAARDGPEDVDGSGGPRSAATPDDAGRGPDDGGAGDVPDPGIENTEAVDDTAPANLHADLDRLGGGQLPLTAYDDRPKREVVREVLDDWRARDEDLDEIGAVLEDVEALVGIDHGPITDRWEDLPPGAKRDLVRWRVEQLRPNVERQLDRLDELEEQVDRLKDAIGEDDPDESSSDDVDGYEIGPEDYPGRRPETPSTEWGFQ